MLMLGVLLAVAGAFTHAVWNVVVKRSGHGGVAYVWLYSALGMPLVVAALVWACVEGFGPAAWAGAVSAVLHTTYAVLVQRAYARHDLGLVYPISRGAAPAMVAVCSVAAYAFAPGTLLVLGIAVTVLGVLLTAQHTQGSPGWPAAGAGLGIAVMTTTYTLWDGHAMGQLGASVVTYLAVQSLTQFVIVSVAVAPQRADLPDLVREHWRAGLTVAVLVPLSYGLVLVAFSFADVAVVAAARSVSIVFTMLLAATVLHERQGVRQRLGAALVVAGVVTIAFA